MKGFVGLLWITWVSFLIWLGQWCVKFDVAYLFHKSIGTGWAIIINILTGELSTLLALGIWLLQLAHVIK